MLVQVTALKVVCEPELGGVEIGTGGFGGEFERVFRAKRKITASITPGIGNHNNCWLACMASKQPESLECPFCVTNLSGFLGDVSTHSTQAIITLPS